MNFFIFKSLNQLHSYKRLSIISKHTRRTFGKRIWLSGRLNQILVLVEQDHFFKWITLQYCSGFFCHTLTWISQEHTCVLHLEPPSHLPSHTIPQGHPSAPALSILSHASNLDWRFISHMIIYMFKCYSLKSSHPHLLTQSPTVCSLYLYLFCCLAYRVIVTIFLNSIYMH